MVRKAFIILWNEFFLYFFKTPIYHPRFWIDEKEKAQYIHSYGFFKKLNTLRHGFNSDKYILYNFAKNNRKLYLNDIRRRILSERISKKYFYIVHNKIVFNKYFNSICNLVPKLALIHKGQFMPIESSQFISSANTLLDAVEMGETFFLKPHDGGSGRGILKVSFDKTLSKYIVNKQEKTKDELLTLIASLKGYIIEKQFIQKGFSNIFYPDTLNTLRIYTMIDPQTEEPFIAAALHRMGTSKSIFADNWSQGGISVWIDTETGKLGKGIQYPFNGVVNEHAIHPDTKIQIEGKVVPQWEEIQKTLLKCASYVYFMPLLGWDIILSDEQIYVLEANYNPDVNLVQVHKPLLENPKIKNFYKHHKVIR